MYLSGTLRARRGRRRRRWSRRQTAQSDIGGTRNLPTSLSCAQIYSAKLRFDVMRYFSSSVSDSITYRTLQLLTCFTPTPIHCCCMVLPCIYLCSVVYWCLCSVMFLDNTVACRCAELSALIAGISTSPGCYWRPAASRRFPCAVADIWRAFWRGIQLQASDILETGTASFLKKSHTWLFLAYGTFPIHLTDNFFKRFAVKCNKEIVSAAYDTLTHIVSTVSWGFSRGGLLPLPLTFLLNWLNFQSCCWLELASQKQIFGFDSWCSHW